MGQLLAEAAHPGPVVELAQVGFRPEESADEITEIAKEQRNSVLANGPSIAERLPKAQPKDEKGPPEPARPVPDSDSRPTARSRS